MCTDICGLIYMCLLIFVVFILDAGNSKLDSTLRPTARDGSTLGQRGVIDPLPHIKKKTSIKKLSFALLYIYIYIYIYLSLLL